MTRCRADRVAWALILGLATPAVAAEAPLWTDAPRTRRERPPALADLVERARPAVVQVRGAVPEPRKSPARRPVLSVGSGFFLDAAGHVVTNEHVVRGVSEIRIRLHDGRELRACIVGLDEATDIALLKTDAGFPLQALPLGDSDAVRAGEVAVAIGSPFGFSHSVTAGIVSANERVLERPEARPDPSPRGGIEGYTFYIQTDAAINVGNSGGPLLDAHGAVIGINAAFWGGTQSAQGVSFAIPINVAKLLLPRLRRDGEAPRSELGVETQAIDAQVAAALQLPTLRGALVASVTPGLPAAAAGLQPGDVLTSWNGHSVAETEDLKIYAQLTPPGTRARLGIIRGGKIGERTVVTRAPDEAPPPRAPPPAACRAPEPGLEDGFELADMAPARARKLPSGRGVEVVKVEGGAAREADLQVGDIVLQIGRTPVASADELRRALEAAPRGKPVALLLLRAGFAFWKALPRP